MSYILEALKKAQAERARGAVPGVDAQPVPTVAPPAALSMRTWSIMVLVLLLACAALYRFGPWGQPEPASAPRVAQAPAAPTPVDKAEPAPRPAPAAAPGAAPAPAVAAAPATTPAPAAASAAAAAPAPATATAPARPLRKLGERASDEPAPAAAASAPAPERIALLQELPAQIQREIPTLAINGYIYASNPADRSVLINNRLRREGDTLAEGFVLEKLLPREMVLNYRGYRYRVSY